MQTGETNITFTVLGRTGPESIRNDDRTTVCVGGYSDELGYIRLFPTRMDMGALRQWNVVTVPVENPSEDIRDESWKIAGSKDEWDTLPDKIRQVDRLDYSERLDLVTSLAGDCANALNDDRRSIGLVEPAEIHDVVIDESAQDMTQLTLDMRERLTKTSYPKLYVEYNCENCQAETTHNQHVTDWELYRYWDNNEDYEGAIQASRISDSDWKTYFLIGNLRHQLTAFIIGSLIRFKKSKMLDHGYRPDDQRGLMDF